MTSYKIVYQGGIGEIIEKKSRFIASLLPIEQEEEALVFLEKIKKQYWDAKHHCFAYVIGEQQQFQRCSDDGEPQGTAGKPILDVLLGEQIHNTIIVVTRYFGGTLLGTGGLVRAYSKAAKEGLANSVIVTKSLGYEYQIETDYNRIGKVQYILAQMNVTILQSDYTDIVKLTVLVPAEQKEEFIHNITEGTNAAAKIEQLQEFYFGKRGEEIILFDRKVPPMK